jgi:hypothetical protein
LFRSIDGSLVCASAGEGFKLNLEVALVLVLSLREYVE